MALELLRCIICPKTPRFSDTSHLLTHVGSKGHLSHLHKLQVRSHGDVQASQQLVMYNIWYQEHNLAELLSDRLQQKQMRQAEQHPNNRRRKTRNPQANIGHPEQLDVLSQSGYRPPIQNPDQQEQRRSRRRVMQDEMDDPNYIPSLPMISCDALLLPSSPYGRPTECGCEDASSHDDGCALSLSFPPPLECTRLKGQVWPGMDVFDSATEEQARKRNQRKDLSVVMIMHANSMKIEPLEITFSVNGSIMRKRHIDDLDNDTNLIEGESPVGKPMVKRQRKDRMKESTARINTRLKGRSRTPRPNGFLKGTSISTTPMHTSSSILTRFLTELPSSPLRAIGNKKQRSIKQKGSALTIFQDANATNLATLPPGHTAYPFVDPLPEYHFVKDLDLNMDHFPWLQAPPPQELQYTPFKDYRQNHQTGQSVSRDEQGRGITEPIIWKNEAKQEEIGGADSIHFSSLCNLSPEFGALSHVYAYTKNPLMDIPAYCGRSKSPICETYPLH